MIDIEDIKHVCVYNDCDRRCPLYDADYHRCLVICHPAGWDLSEIDSAVWDWLNNDDNSNYYEDDDDDDDET